jgi:predicted GNAT family N-acyltransferase
VIRIEPVGARVVLALRAEVLRPGLPLEVARYAADDQPGALHLAALDELGHVIGCSTWFPEPWDSRPGWRLRGMATAPHARGAGIGGLLLERGLAEASAAGAESAWCNARTVALGFYRRYGFETVGEEFLGALDIPHYLMWCALPAAQRAVRAAT